MFGLWLSKRNTEVCATQYNIALTKNTLDNKYLNCGRVETLTHLNARPSDGRTKLLNRGVEERGDWLTDNNHTQLELDYWIPEYIQLHRPRSMTSLGEASISLSMIKAAVSQDKIG